MTEHIYNTPLNDSLSFDDDDVFQCGRCKKQFRSLDVFIQHKREDCSSTTVQFRNGSEKHTVIDISSPFLEPSSDTTSVNYGDTQNHVLATMSVSSENTPALVNNGMNNSSVLHLTPSMMLTDDSLSFTIPVAQHSSLTHIVAHGHNSSQQVLSVSESDLNNLINSSERFHLSSIDQIHNPISSHGLLLTASLISSGKDSNIHLLSNIPSHIQSNGSSNDRCHQNSDTVTSSPLACSMDSQLESISMDVTSRDSQIDEHNLESITVQVVHEPDICNSELGKHGTVLSDSVIDKIVEIVTICTDSDNENTVEDKKKCRTTKGLRGDSESSLSTSRKCEYCGKVFKKVFNLHQHIRSHTGEKPFHCLVCGRGFTQKSNVKKHMQTHKVWPKMKVTLPKEQISVKVKNAQNAEVPAEGSLADISQVEYIVNNVYVCQYCGELFENHHKLKTHMIVHKSEKLFKCNHKDCAATFLEVEGLISHIKNHEDEMEYRCQQCTKVFNNLYDLGAHQYTHRLYPNKISTSVSRSHRCVKCNNKYSSSEALNHHLLTSSHYYPCSQCGLVFVCERYLRRHLKIHSSGEPFQCTQCGKSFKTENYLKSHLVIHSDSKPFNCETCGALFNRRDKLTRHKRIHESRKKFKCPFKPTTGCTREFYRKDKLKDHLLSHSRKTYVCAKCGKSFSWPTKLRHHQVEHHPEMLASTTCNQCHRIFKTKHHLKIHLCKGAIMESGKRAKASNRKGNVSSKMKVNNVRPSFKESCDLEDEEDVMYGDCDIMVKNETGDREESAILVGLTNVGSDHAREILTQYSDSEANEDDGNGVLSTMEIGFETSVGSSSMDPLMAGD